ncbi:uncharacterized protein ARMOST_04245 [Armillaria ostoyae]|uniref:DUF6535 domain-containing protein n=1 Tax=Armillaria ostoyae TaxID=47428 RepID=A0A284QWT7_ARMOS|nr:uncharacterized protein ARMOST_04245 [Armillaria ostoyae]
MSSPGEPNEASSSKSKGKAVDPTEHPNGGRNVDEADKDEDEDEDEEDAELVDEENAVKSPNPVTSSKAKKAFGMHRAQPTARRGNDPSNYEDRFPEDPIYAETAPSARVWRTHQAESAIHDANMVEEIRDNVDVLLVFAGLFSAVVTTFVVQTSQSLQADYTQVSASLLFELLLVQRAIANGSPIEMIPVSSLNPQTAFIPAATDVWVNGLWFTSLFLSLTTALVAVLVKQWLHHYVVLPSGTPRDRCFVRQYRYLGFQKWRVEVIVGMLPVLMHLALALFFIGLSLFLHPLRAALLWVVCTGTVLLIVTYVTVTILPMHFPQCPYRTPLRDLAYPPYIYVTFLVQEHYHRLHQLLQRWRKKKMQSTGEVRGTRTDNSGDNSESDSGRNHIMAKPNSLKQLELDAVEKASLRLSVEALQWLLSASSNPAVQSIVIESIGSLPMEALVEVEDVCHGSPSIVDVQRNLLTSLVGRCAVDWIPFPTPSTSSGMERKFERLLRSCMFIPRVGKLSLFFDVPDQLGRNEFGATLVTQIPKLCRSMPWGCFKPGVFLHNILSLQTSARFPPIVWANLIRSAATDSWHPDPFDIDHHFTMLLCSAVTRIVRADIPKQQLFASPLVVDFEQAVEYFPEIVLEYMMYWTWSWWFVHLPGGRLECQMLAASIHLMIRRLSQSAAGTDTSQTPEIHLLHSMSRVIIEWIDTRKNLEFVWEILESVIVDTPIFSQDTNDSKYDECSRLVLECYGDFVKKHDLPSRIHAPSSALQLLVTFITTQWSTLHTSRRAVGAFYFLKGCLEQRFRPAYDVFHQEQCLEFLAMQPVSLWSASLFRAYVIGIAVAIHPSRDDPEENQMISQAIDRLHEPENLFLVCSTLAMYPGYAVLYEVAGQPDIITVLAQIRPLDPVWSNCCQRLRELANGENSFVGNDEYNIREAIKTLDRCFSDIPPQITASLELPGPPQPQSWIDRLGRLLLWHRSRQQDEEHPLTEGV